MCSTSMHSTQEECMCSTLGGVYEQYKKWCPQFGGLMCKYFLILMCRPLALHPMLACRYAAVTLLADSLVPVRDKKKIWGGYA